MEIQIGKILAISVSELDLGEDWPESEDESEEICGSESLPADIINKVVSAERKNSQTVRIVPDQRKSSTGSNVMTYSQCSKIPQKSLTSLIQILKLLSIVEIAEFC